MAHRNFAWSSSFFSLKTASRPRMAYSTRPCSAPDVGEPALAMARESNARTEVDSPLSTAAIASTGTFGSDDWSNACETPCKRTFESALD